ncbi:type 1 glutamine amidotransferase [Halopseudomonas phragmitis]|uniref:Glutamine amidotransferase n=2 Tax=Pseudomonadaceae TaxID=135621 RepID=A0A1V0B169_9GAMM|nr:MULTISPECIES: type 1 glutamine amidotransferase [Pseudomonadaceae]AQZ93679.1 glutamine amidotransferase [Halopseudomonas phragmitis]PAU85068.1 glutamine amidotransferase [Pseudomonas sp. WN033]RHW20008.1 type 1 glutamine amidotransferase [Pseudomonas jilinensis]
MKTSRAVAILHAPGDVAGTLPELLAEQGIDLELLQVTDPLPAPETLDLLLVLGSPESAYDQSLPWLAAELAWLKRVQGYGVPTLGICFGSQILARALGGQAVRNRQAEIGWTPLQCLVRDEWQHPGPWLNFHFDTFRLPATASLLAETDLAPQAFRQGRALGVQFHPEITVSMFDTWTNYWRSSPQGQQFLATAGDLPERMRAEIGLRAADNKDNCRRLLADFLERF